MEQLIAKLKQMPRWAWWVGGGALVLVAVLALRARRSEVAPQPAEPKDPAQPKPKAPDLGPAPAPAPSQPTGGRDPQRNGNLESWLRSALGGLTDRTSTLALEVARVNAQLASYNNDGMGTFPNKGTVGGITSPVTPTVTSTVTATTSGEEAVTAWHKRGQKGPLGLAALGATDLFERPDHYLLRYKDGTEERINKPALGPSGGGGGGGVVQLI